MKLRSNYHTHLKLCNHATGMSEDYIKVAIEEGMEEIGITDHGPVLKEFMSIEDHERNWTYDTMSYETFYNVYLNDIKNAKAKYSNQIKIYSGLEIEYLEGKDEYYKELLENLDYLNLGIHFYEIEGKIINSYADIDYKNVRNYAIAAVKAMDTNLFKILVHPDLFMFNYRDINGDRIFDQYCEDASRLIIESAIKNNVYLEINVNGINNTRKYDKTGTSEYFLYPHEEFWKIVKEYKNAKIVIGIDAHSPEQLKSKDIEIIFEFAKKIDLKIENFIKL